MTLRSLAAALLSAIVLVMLGYYVGRAASRPGEQSIVASLWTPVTITQAPVADPDPSLTGSTARHAPGGEASAAQRVPSPSPSATTRSSADLRAAASVTGITSWYCLDGRSACTAGYPASGAYAAAGPALRAILGGHWRNRLVSVSAGGRSIVVRLIDWCACGGGKLLDLYGSVFARLAPLSRGLITVRVSWG